MLRQLTLALAQLDLAAWPASVLAAAVKAKDALSASPAAASSAAAVAGLDRASAVVFELNEFGELAAQVRFVQTGPDLLAA